MSKKSPVIYILKAKHFRKKCFLQKL